MKALPRTERHISVILAGLGFRWLSLHGPSRIAAPFVLCVLCQKGCVDLQQPRGKAVDKGVPLRHVILVRPRWAVASQLSEKRRATPSSHDSYDFTVRRASRTEARRASSFCPRSATFDGRKGRGGSGCQAHLGPALGRLGPAWARLGPPGAAWVPPWSRLGPPGARSPRHGSPHSVPRFLSSCIRGHTGLLGPSRYAPSARLAFVSLQPTRPHAAPWFHLAPPTLLIPLSNSTRWRLKP